MSQPKKIAIIGASYLQLPVVEKANELGIETHCFAYLEGAVCKEHCSEFHPISILEKEEILNVCRSLKIDGVLSIASDLAVVTVNYVAHHLGLIGNDLESTEITTNKYKMKQVLKKENLPTSSFEIVKDESDLKHLDNFNYPLIVKPVDRSGSMGVTKIESEAELHDAYEIALAASLCKEVIIEEFITGNELSVESISQNGVHRILAYTDKVTTGAPNFVELEHHQPADISDEARARVNRIVISSLDVLGVSDGAAHSELFVTSQGELYVNEIGARMGGDFIGSHLVVLSTGFDFLEAVIRVALGVEITYEYPKKKNSGVIFKNDLNSDEFDLVSDSSDFVIELESGLSEKRSFLKSGDRGNYFIYQSDKRVNFE